MPRTHSCQRKSEANLAPSLLQPSNRNKGLAKRSDRPLPGTVFRGQTVFVMMAIAIVFSAQRSAVSQSTKQWTTALPFWHNGLSWAPLGIPGPNDLARFNINTTDTVTWNATTGNRSTGRLEVLVGNYTFDNVTAAPFQLSLNSNVSFPIFVSGADTILNVNGLHLNASAASAIINDNATLNLGVGSGGIPGQLTTSVTLGIDGSANIFNGSTVSSVNALIGNLSASNSSALVNGSGSQWNSNNLHVGSNGDGILVVENGGEVSTGSSFIGLESGSFGSAILTDAGSSWMSFSRLCVGVFGSGMLNVQNGGTLSLGFSIDVGCQPNSQGIAIASGLNTLINTFELNIGLEGDGFFVVENGAIAQADRTNIGSAAGSMGLLTVRTGGLLHNSEDVTIGEAGIGTLTIDAGGSVVVENSTVLFPGGNLNLNNGTLTSDSINFNGGGSFSFNAGILHVGTYSGNLVNAGGTLAPGQSAGSTSIIGNYTQQRSGQLEIELGGLAVSDFDRVSVIGAAQLEGTLTVELIDGFTLATGNQFVIVETTSGTTGNFLGLSGGAFVGGFGGIDLFISYAGGDGNDVVLYTIGVLGDVNGDGVVNLLDVAPFVNAVTNGDFVPEADINRDGLVNLLDVSLFVALLTG